MFAVLRGSVLTNFQPEIRSGARRKTVHFRTGCATRRPLSIAIAVVAAIVAISLSGCEKKPAAAAVSPESAIADYEIGDAYLYLLGRVLVLRQQRRDFEQGEFQWNQFVHRKAADPAGANPDFDVAYSQAWVAVDERDCALLEIPRISERYYTVQLLNGWGETLVNINERTFPQQPSGKFALCLKGSGPIVPEGALRVDLPYPTAHVVARIQLGKDAKTALRLQQRFQLTAADVEVPPVLRVPLFSDEVLPGVEIFDQAAEILAGEPDINPGMEQIRDWVGRIAALAKTSDAARARIDKGIEKEGWPTLKELLMTPGPKTKGWSRPAVAGNYGSDYRRRTMTNLAALWTNDDGEVTTFGNLKLDGAHTYLQTFPADALPQSKAGYGWSVTALDSEERAVMANSLNRFAVNDQSQLTYNDDGSLTLAFAPEPPQHVPRSNWLPATRDSKYDLTFRFYGPSQDIKDSDYFPPPLALH